MIKETLFYAYKKSKFLLVQSVNESYMYLFETVKKCDEEYHKVKTFALWVDLFTFKSHLGTNTFERETTLYLACHPIFFSRDVYHSVIPEMNWYLLCNSRKKLS